MSLTIQKILLYSLFFYGELLHEKFVRTVGGSVIRTPWDQGVFG